MNKLQDLLWTPGVESSSKHNGAGVSGDSAPGRVCTLGSRSEDPQLLPKAGNGC